MKTKKYKSRKLKTKKYKSRKLKTKKYKSRKYKLKNLKGGTLDDDEDDIIYKDQLKMDIEEMIKNEGRSWDWNNYRNLLEISQDDLTAIGNIKDINKYQDKINDLVEKFLPNYRFLKKISNLETQKFKNNIAIAYTEKCNVPNLEGEEFAKIISEIKNQRIKELNEKNISLTQQIEELKSLKKRN